MKILLIDDSIDKISDVTSVINEAVVNYTIESAQDIQNAIRLFAANKFDLAIVDSMLPLRVGDDLLPNGGQILLDEMYRKKNSLSLPKYIIGLTQYDQFENSISAIWKTLIYRPGSTIWANSLKQVITHINHNIVNSTTIEIMPTIFVEGDTDKFYLTTALELYHPKLASSYIIKSQSNAGANWVANQIGAWGMKMSKYGNQSFIKAVGLLDGDDAGNKAKDEIFRVLTSENKLKTFKVIQVAAKYNPELIHFYKNSCKISIDIESLFPMEIWEYADEKKWLENRQPIFNTQPTDWDFYTKNVKEYLLGKGFSEKQLLYTKKVKLENKTKFMKYVSAHENKEIIFRNFKSLAGEIISCLSIDT